MALAHLRLEADCPVTIVTKNVGDLHERAGSTHVIHLHGRAFADKCAGYTDVWLGVDAG